MPFASINSTIPRTNPWKFHEKILRIDGAGKWGFFEAAILNFVSRPFWIFFCFISVKNPALLYEVTIFSAIWMVFPESWKRSCSNFYAHDCICHLKPMLPWSVHVAKKLVLNFWPSIWHDIVAPLNDCPSFWEYCTCRTLVSMRFANQDEQSRKCYQLKPRHVLPAAITNFCDWY